MIEELGIKLDNLKRFVTDGRSIYSAVKKFEWDYQTISKNNRRNFFIYSELERRGID